MGLIWEGKSPHGNTLYHTAMDTLGGWTRELLKRDSQTFEARFEHFCGRLDRRYGSECGHSSQEGRW